MPKKSLSFLSGILLTVLIFFFNDVLVKNTSDSFLSKGFQENIHTISNIIDQYQPKPENTLIQEDLLRAFVQTYGDPYTTYISPEEAVAFATMIEGDFEGIGAYIEESPNGVFVQGTLPGSPAQKAGLLPGDIIQTVNGKTAFNLSADKAVSLIRGPAGTAVVLDIFSTALSTKKQVTLIRQKLELPILTDELVGDILYMHLFSFNDYSGRDVEKVLKKYEGKYTKILLDLRDNGGGTLEAAVDVSSFFFSAPKIVSTIDGKDPKKYISKGKSDIDTPVYILVN